MIQHRSMADRLFAKHGAGGGGAIWNANAFWGIPWLAAVENATVAVELERRYRR